jgi:hypothetical protein
MTQQLDWNYVPNSVVGENGASAEENGASTEDHIFFKEIERVTQAHTNSTETPEKWGPGFMTTYWTDVFNTDNERIGTSIGAMIILYKRPSDGHLIEYIVEQIQLKDGSLASEAYLDRTDVLAQNICEQSLWGTSGRYAGMRGTRKYRIEELEGQYPLIAEMELHREK